MLISNYLNSNQLLFIDVLFPYFDVKAYNQVYNNKM